MSDEQMRIEIAEACGWTNISDEIPSPGIGFVHANLRGVNPGGYRVNVPNYLTDLNAMHEAEGMLTEERLAAYGNLLDEITRPTKTMAMCYVNGPEAGMYPELFRATARQRAEAFIATLNP